jgi:hypothetical protein
MRLVPQAQTPTAFHQLYQLVAVLFVATFVAGAILIVLWKKVAYRIT